MHPTNDDYTNDQPIPTAVQFLHPRTSPVRRSVPLTPSSQPLRASKKHLFRVAR